MNKKGVLIQGSSRSNGNTQKIVSYIAKRTGFDIIDLRTKNFGSFDYEFRNTNDDFIPLIREITEKYEILVFATPVYWYAMSGIMKHFFDRITDCLIREKETGRRLRGKSMAMISCGSNSELKEGFTMPFEQSSLYLGMHYLGDLHTWLEDDQIPEKLKTDLDFFISNNLIQH